MQSVHPRVGGEHGNLELRWPRSHGSSPRGRGTPIEAHVLDSFARFIPAWAGNTKNAAHGAEERAVHPRVGGEHVQGRVGGSGITGSSPRGRGTHPAPPCATLRHRFIPAWAGNTEGRARSRGSLAVHPRVGGEHEPNSHPIPRQTGSSPRGRGTRFARRGALITERFIPAWAGNTPDARQLELI